MPGPGLKASTVAALKNKTKRVPSINGRPPLKHSKLLRRLSWLHPSCGKVSNRETSRMTSKCGSECPASWILFRPGQLACVSDQDHWAVVGQEEWREYRVGLTNTLTAVGEKHLTPSMRVRHPCVNALDSATTVTPIAIHA